MKRRALNRLRGEAKKRFSCTAAGFAPVVCLARRSSAQFSCGIDNPHALLVGSSLNKCENREDNRYDNDRAKSVAS